jgi:hypothetical protein
MSLLRPSRDCISIREGDLQREQRRQRSRDKETKTGEGRGPDRWEIPIKSKGAREGLKTDLDLKSLEQLIDLRDIRATSDRIPFRVSVIIEEVTLPQSDLIVPISDQ